jgi:hypothetical protein
MDLAEERRGADDVGQAGWNAWVKYGLVLGQIAVFELLIDEVKTGQLHASSFPMCSQPTQMEIHSFPGMLVVDGRAVY